MWIGPEEITITPKIVKQRQFPKRQPYTEIRLLCNFKNEKVKTKTRSENTIRNEISGIPKFEI